MPYDADQAEKVRATLKRLSLDSDEEIAEKKMFGGLCFALNGKMLMGVGKNRIILRLHTHEYENALAEGEVTPMDFTGKRLAGEVHRGDFAYLAPSECEPADRLLEWAQKSLSFVREKMLARR